MSSSVDKYTIVYVSCVIMNQHKIIENSENQNDSAVTETQVELTKLSAVAFLDPKRSLIRLLPKLGFTLPFLPILRNKWALY